MIPVEMLLLIVTRIAALLLDEGFRARAQSLEQAVRLLIAEITPDLPRKADGTAWTKAELQAVAAPIVDRMVAMKARLQAGLPAEG